MMNIQRASSIGLAAGLIGVLGVSEAAAKPLFESNEPLSITIEAPFNDIVRRASSDTSPHPGELTVAGADPLTIEISARGKSRRQRETCQFPPLRVAFAEKPDAPSAFERQKTLKLVTHCRTTERHEQVLLREYAAYRLLNVVTPQSLRVRLARIDYVDSKRSKKVATRLGFFIEDVDDAAKRNDMKEIDRPSVRPSQLSAVAAARYALFQYMIGNLDWSVKRGPEGSDCCHNTKLIGETKTSESDIVPVPYDFDYSGLVDAPYAVPPEGMNIRKVTDRRYRGFCANNGEVIAARAIFLGKKDELIDGVSEIDGLEERTMDKMVDYLAEFFETLEDDDKFNKRVTDECR